ATDHEPSPNHALATPANAAQFARIFGPSGFMRFHAVADIQARLALYRAGKPYREPSRQTPATTRP
ncbi:MAG: hypothetical protein NTV86_09870, partial [Planctomycetota bacterium]|nr:hypothetical protein [Planctomycetota bacterium]